MARLGERWLTWVSGKLGYTEGFSPERNLACLGEGEGISKEETERRKQQSLGETVKNSDILCAGYLTLEERLQMWHVRGSQSPLPYAIFITKILEHFGVSLDGETKVALNLRESKIDIEVVHNMGFVIDHVTRRTYNHRTDRPTRAYCTQPA
ncbi:hypothetical protein Lal_00022180 [Lupinus albus]|nr:hypothetical protein Lal_00022180 [Lupinus albus]